MPWHHRVLWDSRYLAIDNGVAEACNCLAKFSNKPNNKGKSMKYIHALSLLGLLSLFSATSVQAQQTTGGTEKAVAALEHQWTQSQKTNNPDLVAPLIADKFIYTASDGKVSDKVGLLAQAKTIKWTSVETLDEKVTVFGDTAIATGEFKGKGTGSSGKPIDDHTHYTDVWVKMPDGKWQCVSSQDSPLKM
jgi:ketosteroid isomerase-like protein